VAILNKYIRPDVLTRVQHYKFVPRQLVEGTLAGAHKSPFHGFAIEFAGHREYVPGDDLRHLDWNVYYRQGRHYIKQYEMETNLVCHLMLDISSSMRFGEEDQQKLLYASRMAVTLAYMIVEQSDKVSMGTFDEKVRDWLRPSNNLGQVLRMSQMLEDCEPVHKTKIGQSMLELAGRAGRRSIVIVLSDLFVDLDDLRDAVERLRYDRHEIVLMQILHNDEINFNLEGMVRFVGLEGADEFLTRPQDIRDGYLQAFERHRDRIAQICEANRCEHLICDTSRDMGEFFADYLQQRAMQRQLHAL
jgi:uncharacterized protein (DUF58 family)